MLDKKDRHPELAEFVIQGITQDGQTFRPSNWGERLSDMLGTPGKDGRIVYSSYVRPIVSQGISSVVVRFSLEHADPHAYELIKQFVISNHLMVRAGRNRMDVGATGVFPTISMERRHHQPKGW